jgi:subtilase family serine protease
MAQAVAPAVRIVDRIDDNNLVTLKGNTHPLANAKNDRGRVSSNLPMTDLILVLSRDPAQQAAFDKFVASQYDPASPNFHHWLTPQQVGADFGPSETDIATISGWLTGHGFSIGDVTKDRMTIRFSGSAAQVQSAFHTEIHNLEVMGVHHIGNMSDPQIPAALAQVVVGVKSLHNFFPRPLLKMGSKVTRDSATGRWLRVAGVPAESAVKSVARPAAARPQFGINVPASGNFSAYLIEDVTPYDFAAIYNVLPLWTAGTPIDGTGQTIAIVGTSDIAVSDITTFRSSFGLPAYTAANQPTVVSGNSQPLTVCTDTTEFCDTDDLIENTLDVEWSGATAKGANIVLVASYPASETDDALYDSANYIVSNQTASIMNMSYGACELYNSTAGNVLYYNLWQSASTEGIAAFVASGDAGSASCDTGGDAIGTPYSAQLGLSVSGMASTPFNTAVGGTDFTWCTPSTTVACTAGSYWNSSNAANGSNATGYIPEIPWNDSCANSQLLSYIQEEATSISVTGVVDAESACNFVYNNWQSINTNTGIDLSELIDTVGGGGGASGCVVSDGVSTCTAAATSTGPSNGSITLVTDGWPKPSWQTNVNIPGLPADGVRDLPDVSFFASNGFLSSAYLMCVSALGACTYSTTSEPTAQEVGGTSVASATMAGVMALINQKAGEAQGSPNAELYTLAAAETYANCSSATVANSSTCYFNDVNTDTIAVPCDYGAEEGYPSPITGIDSPNCTVETGGDLIGILPGYSAGAGYDQATGLGSLNVANVVNAWPAATATATATVTVSPAQTTVLSTTSLSVPVTVAPTVSNATVPTGTVTLLGGGYTSAAEPLSGGTYTFTIPANSLAVGSDTLTVSYSGDSTYLAATGTAPITVTGTSGSTGTFTMSASTPASVTPGNSATSTVTVTASGDYSGTVTLACALTSSPSGASDPPTCSSGSTTVTLSSGTTSGIASVSVSTTGATNGALTKPTIRKGNGWASCGAVLAFLIFLGIPKRRRIWRTLLGAVAVLAVLGGMTACGDFWQAPTTTTTNTSGTTTGTYTFTVTGTGDPTVSPAVTTTFTVTVTAAT